MNHVKALIIKFVMVTVVLAIALTVVYDVSIGDMLLTSAAVTVLAYLAGDLVIFKKTADSTDEGKGNMIATVSDLVLAYFVIWIMGFALFGGGDNFGFVSFAAALVIAAGEWFFHPYLYRNVLTEPPTASDRTM